MSRHESWNLTGDKRSAHVETEAHHRRLAAEFDAWAQAGRGDSMETGHMPTAGQALARIPFDRMRPQVFVDLGCGNGYAVRWAARRMHPGGEAIGIDVSERMLEAARQATEAWRVELREAALPVTRFERATFDDLPLESGGVDHLFTNEALYYAPEVEAALAEVVRVLKPGGTVRCAIDYYAENPISHSWPDKTGLPMVFDSESGWKTRFQQAGLAQVETMRLLDPKPVPPLDDEQESDLERREEHQRLVAWKKEIGTLLIEGTKPGS